VVLYLASAGRIELIYRYEEEEEHMASAYDVYMYINT